MSDARIPAAGRHLDQIDAVRTLSCLSVIAVHVVANTNPIQDVGANAASVVLHYSREVFFFVSALVLVHAVRRRLTPQGRLPDPGAFRRRRLTLIGTPYVFWSVAYLALWALVQKPGDIRPQEAPWALVRALYTGTGGFHLYFLLVSIEFGLAFPALLWLLWRTRGHHVALLSASAALQVGTLAVYHHVWLPDGLWRPLIGEASLPAYQLWLVAGGVAAVHLDRFHTFVTRNRALVAGLALLAVAGAEAAYLAAVSAGTPPEFAGRTLQPATVPWAAASVALLYLVAVGLTGRRLAWARPVFRGGARLSFGMYLVHPLVMILLIRTMTRHGPHWWPSSGAPATLLVTVLTVAGAAGLAALLNRTPLSSQLIGRPQRRPVPSSAPAATPAALPATGSGGTAAQPAQPAPAASRTGVPARPTRPVVGLTARSGVAVAAGDGSASGSVL